MTPRTGGPLSVVGRALRSYTVALGVTLGQIGPIPLTPPPARPPIVRTDVASRDALGFDPRERPGDATVLTVPLALATMTGPGPDDSPWVRAN